MRIETLRFGNIEVNEESVYSFPEGVLGFPELKKFALINHNEDSIFLWLQSCENPAVAFPIVDPFIASDTFHKLSTKENPELNTSKDKNLRIISIVTIPNDPTLMTANFKAPIVLSLSEKTGRQVVLNSKELQIRGLIFDFMANKSKGSNSFKDLSENVKLACLI